MDQINERELWHDPKKNVMGLFEAVKYIQNRELMFLKGIKVRWIRARNFNFLQTVFKTFDVSKKKCCAYASLDYYRNIPMFTANLNERTKETKKWIEHGGNKIFGVDFGVDLDYKETDWRSAEKDLFDLLKIYERSKIKYAVWKTSHGFHIVVPYKEIVKVNSSITPEEARDFYYLVAEKLQKKFPTIDMSAYMETRVFRCPYLLDHEDEVVLPLRYGELPLLFAGKLETKPSWVIKNIRLRNRGVFMNGEEGNFQKFVEEVDKL